MQTYCSTPTQPTVSASATYTTVHSKKTVRVASGMVRSQSSALVVRLTLLVTFGPVLGVLLMAVSRSVRVPSL